MSKKKGSIALLVRLYCNKLLHCQHLIHCLIWSVKTIFNITGAVIKNDRQEASRASL